MELEADHVEQIKCPECETVQSATVVHGIPFNIYVHHCYNCNYIIAESEWDAINPPNQHKNT